MIGWKGSDPKPIKLEESEEPKAPAAPWPMNAGVW